MSKRATYEKLLSSYPDVVSLKEFRAMLGDITEGKALKILEQGHIKCFLIGRKRMIPKVCVIDYLIGKNSSLQPGIPVQLPGIRRKPGTGCLYQINDHLWEGKYSPRNAYGKRISKNVYAKTRADCEKKLMVLIEKMDKQIMAEKARISYGLDDDDETI